MRELGRVRGRLVAGRGRRGIFISERAVGALSFHATLLLIELLSCIFARSENGTSSNGGAQTVQTLGEFFLQRDLRAVVLRLVGRRFVGTQQHGLVEGESEGHTALKFTDAIRQNFAVARDDGRRWRRRTREGTRIHGA